MYSNERHHIQILRNRIDFLTKRIYEFEKTSGEKRANYDRAERAAIAWAIRTALWALDGEQLPPIHWKRSKHEWRAGNGGKE